MAEIADQIIRCEILPALCPPLTDHFPIVTIITLLKKRADVPPTFNFGEVNWQEFKKKLSDKLDKALNLRHIKDQQQLTMAVEALTSAIQDSIQENIAKTKPCLDAKRWWNRDLGKERKELNRIRLILFKNCALINHPSHKELKSRSNRYGEAIIQAK
jgi:hypothetical protein